MGGYCPVALIRHGLWKRGRAELAVEIDGRRYLAADEQARQALLREGEGLLPAVGGDCVVSLVDRDESLDGLPLYALQYGKEYLLFAGAEERDRFIAAPERYEAALHRESRRVASAASR